MSNTDNGNFLSGLTRYFQDLNAQEREMNLRDAARLRGPDGGRMDETGLPKINIAEWIAGLRGRGAQTDIQRQTSANQTAKTVNENLKTYPELQRLPQQRKGGEDDLAYNTRRLAEQDTEIAIRDAIRSGVPRDLLRDTGKALTPAEVSKIKEIYEDNQGVIKLINNEELGPKLLADLRSKNDGKRLTSEQLAGVLSDARGQDPVRLSNLETAQVKRDVAEGTLDLERLVREDRNQATNATIALENARLGVEERNAAAERDYRYRSDQADRDLKETLTMLGFDDKAAERELRYEEKQEQNRQLMILQLLKGLQGLGTAFVNQQLKLAIEQVFLQLYESVHFQSQGWVV